MRQKLFLFITFISFSYCATTQVIFSYQYNLNTYLPYSSLAKEYVKVHDNVKSTIYGGFVSFPIIRKNKSTFRFGLNYKFEKLVVKDRWVQSYEFNYKTDFICKSNLIGIHLNYDRFLVDLSRYVGSFGVQSELYLFEFYKSYFYRVPYQHSYIPVEYNYLKPSLSTLSIYYLNTFQLAEKLSLGIRINAGMNLYSKWDQFSRYAWIGAGVELGLGRQ